MTKYPDDSGVPRYYRGNTRPNTRALQQLADAQSNWNRLYGHLATALGYEYLGVIGNEKELQLTREWLFDNLIMPSGDVLDPGSMTLQTLDDYVKMGLTGNEAKKEKKVHQKARRRKARKAYAPFFNEIVIGNRVIRFHWQHGTRRFSTLAIAGMDGIVFDTMLSHAFEVVESDVPADVQNSDCRQREVYWIFTSKVRGKVWCCLKAYCTAPLQCDGEAEGFMVLGDYESRLVPHPGVPVLNCCRSTWVWALATPLVDITVTVTATGGPLGSTATVDMTGVGSRAGGTLSLRDCCAAVTTTGTGVGTGSGTSVGGGTGVGVGTGGAGTVEQPNAQEEELVGTLSEPHRGRIQIQGPDMRPEISEKWARQTPLPTAEGLTMHDRLVAQLTRTQLRNRRQAIPNSRRFINNNTVQTPPRFSRSFRDRGQRHNRVDIEVHTGTAFS